MSFLSDLRLSPVGLGGRLHHAMARDYRTIHRRYPEGPEDPLLGRFFGKGRVVFGGRTQRGSTASAKDDLSHIRSLTGCHACGSPAPRKSGMARSGWRPPMESTPELRTAMWKR